MSIGELVFLDGDFLPANAAKISPFDRGYLFAHAAYEVTAVYGGQLIDADAHMARLQRTLNGIDVPMPWSAADLLDLHEELRARNGLEEGLIYLQVSAGDYGTRDFAGPDVLTPNLFLFTLTKPLIDTPLAREGGGVILLPDTRWARRDFKTTQLLSQVLAYREADKAGAVTAWFHERGEITEGASANAWIVKAGEVITRPLTASILAGVTRQQVAKLLTNEGYTLTERAFTPQEAQSADEAFTTSAGAMVLPVTAIDGVPVGSGDPGPATRLVQRLYFKHIGVNTAQEAPWLGEG